MKWSRSLSGVEPVIGSWKIRPRSGPRIGADLLWRGRRQIAVAVRISRRRGALGQEPEIAAAERRLAAAGLARRGRASRPERISNETPSTARTGSPSVPYQARGCGCRGRRRSSARCSGLGRDLAAPTRRSRISGLRMSFSPSPTSVSPVTRRTIARPGNSPSTRSRRGRRDRPLTSYPHSAACVGWMP